MASGQPQGPPQQGPYPGYASYQPVHKPMVDYVRPMVSDALLAVGVVLAIFLLWLGAVISGLSDDRDIDKAGSFVKSLGMLILTIALFVGGLIRTDMEKWVRTAMIVGAVLLIALVGFWSETIVWPF